MPERLDRKPADDVVVPAEVLEQRRVIATRYHALSQAQKINLLVGQMFYPHSMWTEEQHQLWGLMKAESLAMEGLRTEEQKRTLNREKSLWEKLEDSFPPLFEE